MADAKSDGPRLPSEEEIAKLPRWAQVAFAARCARRVQPLFTHLWPEAPDEHVRAVDEAVALAERSGATASFLATVDAINAAHNAHNDQNDAYAITAHGAAYAAAHAAAAAHAHKAAHAYHAARAADAQDTTSDDAYAIGYVTRTDFDVVHAAMRHDFELLRQAAVREGWSGETPVPPEFFGPMWPDGAPEGWPSKQASSEEETTALQLHFEIPDGVDKAEADRLIQEIILAANELHLAYGGSGLKLADRVKVYEPALVPAGGER